MNLKSYFFTSLLMLGITPASAGLPVVIVGCDGPCPPRQVQPAPTASESSVDESKKVANRAGLEIIPDFPEKIKTSNGLIEFVTPVLVNKSKSCS